MKRGKARPQRGIAATHRLCLALLGVLLASVALAQTFPQGFVGKVSVSPAKAVVGQEVTLAGTEFPAGSEVELVWTTYDVDWDLGSTPEGRYDGNFYGIESAPREEPLATATSDSQGSFEVTFTVPEDYGGTHTIMVRQDGVNVNQAGVFVPADMSLSPESGPLGTNVTVRITGLDAGQPMAYYLLSYDHRITGFVSAVRTNGTAEFEIPATGAVGPHLIRLEDSPFGHPYMPLDTSPWAHLEVPSRTFMLTEGAPVLPGTLVDQALTPSPGTAVAGDGPAIWVDPVSAAVGTPATLHGSGFEPGASITLNMSNMVGSRVTSNGFAPVIEPFGETTADAEGHFAYEFAYPDTLGGFHVITAGTGPYDDMTELADVEIRVLPIALELESTQVRYGDVLRLHLKGIGWSQTENIFGIVIDNTYIGYGCGFSTNGDVQVPIEVSWEPGWHFIDIYPSFYRNRGYSEADEAPFLFRQGLLSWEDHPSGFHFRYAFEVLPPEGAAN